MPQIEHGCRRVALRRAAVVKAELIRDGMSEENIQIAASEDLMVPTARNQREPQNRRVGLDWE